MILCINANAAVDKTVVVNGFRLNEIHRPQHVLAVAGGKGVNVARGLQRLGEVAVVAGWVGGFNGQFIAAGLQHEGIATAFIHTDVESRTCLSILDPEHNTLTEIYEKGEPVSAGKVAEFKQLFQAIIPEYTAVTFSGSLPPHVPTAFYGELLELAHAAGIPGFLDSSGDALRQGLEIGYPVLIKPNAEEFAELVNRKLERVEDIAEAAVDVAKHHGTSVAVSLGSRGVIAANGNELLHIRPPQLIVKSAVGSGDCMLAGITYGLMHGFSFQEAMIYGVAAGSANALTIGAGRFTMDDFEFVRSQVTVVRQ
ncbi:MAG: 1-phosphofructokinase family hexose kinase [Herpetosiphonaceae bacterium]|nr:1-phosphofructokinase family hexose kinase [Herpetosiphonaceae bacterium]